MKKIWIQKKRNPQKTMSEHMARRKEKKFKEHLTKALNKNKRAPVWIYQKTKDRSLIRGRKRRWRYDKLRLKTQHLKKKAKLTKHRNPKYK